LAESEKSRIVHKVAWRIMPLIMACDPFASFDRIHLSCVKFFLHSDPGSIDTSRKEKAGMEPAGNS
jgi:hypothetical protein